MSGFNSAVILGRCKSTEELQTRNGKLFVKAIIAVSVHRKNAEGNDEERTSLIPSTIFGRQAEVFLKYVKPGDMVHLVGRIESNEYTANSGEKRLSLSFVVEQLNLLFSERGKAQQNQSQRRPEEKPQAGKRPQEPERNEYGEPTDIPF